MSIPVFGSGDCVEPGDIVQRLADHGVGGVLVGRGALKNPWIFAQASAARRGDASFGVSMAERGQFLLDYIELLLHERVDEADGFRHTAPGQEPSAPSAFPVGGDPCTPPNARGHERWVINKLRALGSWYTKGLEGGGQLRVAINSSESIDQLRETIQQFFLHETVSTPA